MTEEEILTRVRAVLAERCGVHAELSANTRLAEDLGLDSIGLLTLALELENHYQLQLGDDPANPPRSVGDVVSLIAKGLEENRGARVDRDS